MSYQVLARKWRPQNFKEMVGQQHVLRALINALDEDRLHHAYLFTGTRGVGKTTIARILAKCLNCETGVTSKPCGECSSCKEIAAGSFVDLIEVDAASRTKVEDTRELLDNVQYAPTRGRFKVYLIDEVHMLTGHSFNALLKTLEEPPPHVKFLFATTDPQKLPVTILSRCLQFNLKRMPVDMITGHLHYLTEKESISSDEPSLKLIARAADGSMRDALSLLDQSIAFGGGELKEADVREMLGTISHEPLVALLKAVLAGEGAAILQQIEDMAGVTPDFEAATDALIALLHQVAVQQVVPEALQDDESVAELAELLSKEDVQLYYQIALHGRRDIPLSPDPRSGFEMILLRMLAFKPLQQGMSVHDDSQDVVPLESKKKTLASEATRKNTDNLPPARSFEETIASIEDIEIAAVDEKKGAVKNTSAITENSRKLKVDDVPWEVLPDELNTNLNPDQSKPDNSGTDAPRLVSSRAGSPPFEKDTVENHTVENHTVENKVTKDPLSIKQPALLTPECTISPDRGNDKTNPEQAIDKNASWHDIVPHLALGGRAAELIKHCLLESKENGIITLSLDKASEGLLAESIEHEIQTALTGFYAETLKLKLEVNDLQKGEGEAQTKETPAQRTARNIAETQENAEQTIANDPFVIELQNRFGAQVVPGSVHPK